MSEDTFSKIPTKLFSVNLSSLQFRFLCNFIRISGINNGHSFFGYPNLAQINQCGRAAAIKTVQELEKMGFIQVVDRGNRSRSNDILLTLEKGFLRCENGGFCAANEGYLKDTPQTNEGYLKDTRGYLKDTRGYLKDTPHNKIKDLNNLNLNNYTGEGYLKDTPKGETEQKKNIATGDVAPVRSMPIDESAKNVCAESQCEIEDYLLADSFFKAFSCFEGWTSIENNVIMPIANTNFIIRNFNRILDENKAEIDKFFAEKKQKITVFCEKNSEKRKIIINNI